MPSSRIGKYAGLVAVVCLIGLGIVLAGRGGRTDDTARSNAEAAPVSTPITITAVTSPIKDADPTATPLPETPEHVRFRFLFEHLGALKDKPGMLRSLEASTGLPDAAFEALVQLAAEHEQQASILDQRAKIIIDNFHAQYPRHLPPGMLPPPPPQELLDLQDQRDALALAFRDRLRTAIGEETYTRFKQQYMDEEFKPKQPNRLVTEPRRPVTTQKEDK